MNINQEKYDDIINMEHHVSKKHPPMLMEARAAQFAPFDALTGLKSCIRETEQELNYVAKIELSDDLQERISEVLKRIKKDDRVRLKYYSDKIYKEIESNIIKVKEIEKKIILENDIEVSFFDISEIEILTKYYRKKGNIEV